MYSVTTQPCVYASINRSLHVKEGYYCTKEKPCEIKQIIVTQSLLYSLCFTFSLSFIIFLKLKAIFQFGSVWYFKTNKSLVLQRTYYAHFQVHISILWHLHALSTKRALVFSYRLIDVISVFFPCLSLLRRFQSWWGNQDVPYGLCGSCWNGWWENQSIPWLLSVRGVKKTLIIIIYLTWY